MSQLDELRQIYVTEVDDELRIENEAQIREWEQSLALNEGLLSWKSHDITQQIMRQARESLSALAVQLAQNRELTEAQRLSLWAKQDAMRWFLSLAATDAHAELERINAEINAALNATN